MTFGEKIALIRKKKALSQEDLAELSGVSTRTIQRIENNSSKPRPSTIQLLTKILEFDYPEEEQRETIEFRAQSSFLKKVNFSVLSGLFIPFGNILLPLAFWFKGKSLGIVNDLGKKIISLQIYITVLFSLGIFIIPVISKMLTGSVYVGDFPVFLLLYLIFGITNLSLVIYGVKEIEKENEELFSSVPTLF